MFINIGDEKYVNSADVRRIANNDDGVWLLMESGKTYQAHPEQFEEAFLEWVNNQDD